MNKTQAILSCICVFIAFCLVNNGYDDAALVVTALGVIFSL